MKSNTVVTIAFRLIHPFGHNQEKNAMKTSYYQVTIAFRLIHPFGQRTLYHVHNQ